MRHPNKTIAAVARTVAALALAVSFAAGCDDATESSAPATRPSVAVEPTTQPTEASAVVASYPMRPPAVFSVDGHEIPFPAAQLAVVSHHGGLTLRLCSDDPPTAIDPGYAGNSFIMDMRLPIDRVEDIPASTWDHKPADADDSVSGIFVHGYRDGLRPYDVHVTFQKTDDTMLVYVDGTFLRDDPQNPAAPPERVHVNSRGALEAVFPATAQK